MSESYVQVTEGSGKKLHSNTRSINGETVHDEIVVLGEPYLPTYVLSTGGFSTATAGQHLLQIMAGASRNLRIRRIYIEQDELSTVVSRTRILVRRLTSAGSGGSTFTPNPLDTADGAASASGMIAPSAAGAVGALLMSMVVPLGNTWPLLVGPRIWEFSPPGKPIVIPMGATNGIVFVNEVGVANATLNIHVEFDETSF